MPTFCNPIMFIVLVWWNKIGRCTHDVERHCAEVSYLKRSLLERLMFLTPLVWGYFKSLSLSCLTILRRSSTQLNNQNKRYELLQKHTICIVLSMVIGCAEHIPFQSQWQISKNKPITIECKTIAHKYALDWVTMTSTRIKNKFATMSD